MNGIRNSEFGIRNYPTAKRTIRGLPLLHGPDSPDARFRFSRCSGWLRASEWFHRDGFADGVKRHPVQREMAEFIPRIGAHLPVFCKGKSGEQVPNFTLEGADDKQYELKKMKGKVVVLTGRTVLSNLK